MYWCCPLAPARCSERSRDKCELEYFGPRQRTCTFEEGVLHLLLVIGHLPQWSSSADLGLEVG